MLATLLGLPAEIRNVIYELVLTEKNGVNCRLDSGGTKQLCLYESETGEDDCGGKVDDSLEAEQEEEEDDDDDDDEDDPDEEAEQEAAAAEKLANLDISGQLEEGETINLELTDRGCVQIRSLYRVLYMDGDDLRNKPIRHTIANQLQFVCHQLRQETRRLSLRYNKIVFSTPSNDEAMLLCERFLNKFPVRLAQNLTTLAIKVKALPIGQGDGLATVMEFCRATPAAQVYMHIGQLSKPRRLIELALRFSRMYNRHVPFLANQNGAAMNRLDLEDIKRNARSAPDNFRLRYGYCDFNEAALRRTMNDEDYMRRGVLPALRGDVNGFVKFVKEFVEVGI